MALSSKSHHHRHPSTTSNISSVSSSVSVMMKFKCGEYSNSSSVAHQNLTFQSSVDGAKEPELPLKKHRQQQQNKKGAAELINNNREILLDDCCSVSSSLSSSSLVNSDFYYFANRGVDIKKLSPDSSTNETVDSGLSSDTEGFTPPPLPRRANKKAVTTSGSSKSELLMLLDDSQSDVSADSLALNDDAQTDLTSLASVNSSSCDVVSSPVTSRKQQALPNNLLTEIRTKAVKLHHYQQPQSVKELGKALDSQLKLQRSKSSSVPPSRSRSLILAIPSPQQQQQTTTTAPSSFDPLDGYYQRFHMCEYIEIDSKNNNNNNNNNNNQNQPESPIDDLSFVGLKDILNVEKSGQTIRSHKSGTVRGVRNRVRAGITTFLQGKTFKVSGIVATLLIYRFLLLYIPPNVFKICFNILSSFFCLLLCMVGRVLSL